jgi:serine/threonine protein phosphatase 1
MGNHEQMMIDALSGDSLRTAESWLDNGGATTLDSYKVPPGAQILDWAQAVPLAHLQWMKTRTLMHVEGGYLFTHAGIRPGRPIKKQRKEDLLWIREPFLSSTATHPLIVVHGHTPRTKPDVQANRIGIDTGAVMGGTLTCVVLEDDTIGFLTA